MTCIWKQYGRDHNNREANTNQTLFRTREHAAQQKHREHPYRHLHDKHPKRDALKIAVYKPVLSYRVLGGSGAAVLAIGVSTTYPILLIPCL